MTSKKILIDGSFFNFFFFLTSNTVFAPCAYILQFQFCSGVANIFKAEVMIIISIDDYFIALLHSYLHCSPNSPSLHP